MPEVSICDGTVASATGYGPTRRTGPAHRAGLPIVTAIRYGRDRHPVPRCYRMTRCQLGYVPGLVTGIPATCSPVTESTTSSPQPPV